MGMGKRGQRMDLISLSNVSLDDLRGMKKMIIKIEIKRLIRAGYSQYSAENMAGYVPQLKTVGAGLGF